MKLATRDETAIHLDALLMAARANEEKGDTLAAIDVWREVHKLAPQALEPMSALAFLLSSAGRHAEAIELLERVVEQCPGEAAPMADLGRALLSAGEPERALGCLERAVLMDPGSALALVNLGATLQALGDIEAAIESYRRAATLAPRWHIPHYDLGVAVHRRGDWFGARLHMLRAAELASDDGDVRAALSGIVPSGISEVLLPSASKAEEYAFSGLLAKFGVPGLLEFLKNNRSTGTLIIAWGEGGAVLWIMEGDLVGGGAPGVPRLGELLVREGALTERNLDRALASRDTEAERLLLGPYLLARRAVTLEALQRASAAQVQAVLVESLEWKEGHFHFAEGPVPGFDEATARALALDTRVAILEAARLVDERAHGRGA